MHKEAIISYLKKLDLSEIEAKLYLTLLETGPVSVRQLAETTAIKRTTAYFYIDQLIEKGLIMKTITSSKKQVAANSPENLHEIVEKKIKIANELKQDYPEVIKKFSFLVPTVNDANESEIKYFKGITNVKKIYQEALKTNELRTYVKLEETNSPFPEDIELFRSAFREK